MNRIKLSVLFLGALVCGRPAGLCTVNSETAKTEDPPKPTVASNSEEIAALKAQLNAQGAELEALRRAAPVALPVHTEPVANDSTSLLIKGAGVEMEDVGWRIRAGLTPAQAVEVALAEKLEREGEKKSKSRSKSKGSALTGVLMALLLMFVAMLGVAAATTRGSTSNSKLSTSNSQLVQNGTDATDGTYVLAALPSMAIDRWIPIVLLGGLCLIAVIPRRLRPHLRGRWVASLRQCRTANAEGTTGTHEKGIGKYTDAAISRYRLVKRGTDNDHIAASGVGDIAYAVTADEASAAESRINVLLLGKGPTKKMTADGAMAMIGVRVYAGATGKVSLTGTVEVGILLSTAAADGDIVEVADYPPPSAPGISSTSASLVTPDIGAATGTSLVLSGGITATGGTLTSPVVKDLSEVVAATNVLAASESGKTCYLASATEFVSTLPAPALGLRFKFVVSAAPSGASYTIVTTSGTDLIHGVVASAEDAAGSVDSTAGTAADTITFVDGKALKGDQVTLESDGTSWYATGICAVQDAITFTQS